MKKKEIYKFIISYIKKHKALFIMSTLPIPLYVCMSLYIPVLTGNAIDFIIAEKRVNFDKILPIIVVILIAALLAFASQWLMSIAGNKLTFKIVMDIRNDAFAKLVKLPINYVDSNPHGDIMSRIMTDADRFGDGLLMGFNELLKGILTIVLTLIFMLVVNVRMALVVIVLTPISLVVASYIARKTYHMFRDQSLARSKLTSYVEENISNEKLVKAYGMEEDSIEGFEEINEELKRTSLKGLFFSSLTNPVTRFVNSIVYAGVGLSGAYACLGGMLSVGSLSCFLSYANQYTKPFNEISGVITELQNAIACVERIRDFLLEEEDIDAGEICDMEINGNVSIKVQHDFCM